MGTTRDHVAGIAIVHLMKTGGTSIGRAITSQFVSFERYPRVGHAAHAAGQKVNPDQLLDLTDDERAALRFVSVHMPAWVVGAAVPHLPTATMLRHPVDRCVSHLRQIARTNGDDQSLEELWEHPPIHRRLANYQTQVFAADEATFHNRPRLTELPADVTEQQKAALIEEVLAAKQTGLGQVIETDEESLRAAIERLESIDVVGITEDLAEFSTRLATRTGLSLPEVGHDNRATDDETATRSLRARIATDSELDLELFEHATTLCRIQVR